MAVSRERILAEVKRTAEANGGLPLGIARFEAATGVRRADWHGKYWGRWGDALIEAGYPPNKLQGAHDRDAVVEQFIELVRQFQRLPTFAEMRIAARTSDTVPAHNTFVKYVGDSPRARIETLRSFCTEHEGYVDVLALLPDAYSLTEDEKAPPFDNGQDDSFGFVYMLKSGRHYKIGRSNSSGRREYEIALQMPEKVTKVHEIRTDDPVGIEAYWHRRFADRRANGEWFSLTKSDVAAFKRRRDFM